MRRIFFLVMGLVALNMGATLSESLDSLLSVTYPDATAPGYSIVIVAGDDTVYNRQWGMADMERQTPVTASTRFNIASISKQFTAASVLQMYSRGLVDIDAPISTYFPEFGRYMASRHPASDDESLQWSARRASSRRPPLDATGHRL